MTKRKPRGWKALLAMFIGGGAVAWHIMACVESPMSFSPNGDLAFTVMDPYEPDILADSEIGPSVFRLMILSKKGELREIERTGTHLLSGPAYSPDGTRFAYLRIPLLTKEDKARIEAFIENRYESYEQARRDPADEKWIFVAPENPVSRPPDNPLKDISDHTLPYESSHRPPGIFDLGGGIVPVELVIREAASGEVVKTVPVDVPTGGGEHIWTYFLTRPQFAPGGRRVHFWNNFYSLSVNLDNGTKSLLGPPSLGGRMSPDGRSIATLYPDEEVLGLLRTDGSRTIYIRLEDKPSFSGLAWAGDDALLVLGGRKSDGPAPLDIYDADGRLIRSLELPLTGANSDNTGELAVSPDRKFIVVSYGEEVHWLDFAGTVLASWKSENEDQLLVQPTFTPDSSQVAFKSMVKEKTDGTGTWAGTEAIVFFTPEGRELSRIPVPRAGTPEPQQKEP